jgi:hypothetical protein
LVSSFYITVIKLSTSLADEHPAAALYRVENIGQQLNVPHVSDNISKQFSVELNYFESGFTVGRR